MPQSIAGQRPPRGRLVRLLAASALLVTVAVVSAFIHVDEYAITPGSATMLGPRISLNPEEPKAHGRVAMVDVNLSQMTILSRFIATVVGSPRHFPGSVFGFEGTTGLEKYFLQSYLTMDQAKHDAVIAAFRAAGRPIAQISTGMLIYDATSSSSLHLGDFLESVNGRAVATICALATALTVHGPLNAVLRRGHLNADTGALRFGPSVSVTLKRTSVHRLVAYEGRSCKHSVFTNTGVLAAATANLERTNPSVTINTKQIGGPSAGLAMALSLTNQLEHGRLLRGRSVATTGTIDARGDVGDVGGVPEKAVAVGRDHFTLFFVPEVEVKAARLSAPSTVTVVGVRTLAEAITALKSR